MKGRISALRERLGGAALGDGSSASLRCELAKELTLAGDFEGAQEALGGFWPEVGARPLTAGLDKPAAAELLLRAGVLTGWLGSAKQVNQSQELAKDLISEGLGQFEALGDVRKVAEAQTELAFCYWREGALDDARALTRAALERLRGDDDRELRAWALTRAALVERTSYRLNDGLRLLEEAAPLLAGSDNHPLLGRFHQTLANNLQVLGVSEARADYIDRALVEYSAAAFHFELAGDMPNCARTENNVGYLLQRLGKFDEAHEHFDRAALIFRTAGDGASVAQVEDSRAQCLLAEGRPAEGERVSRRAAAVLARGDEQSWLAEALITRGTALARLKRLEEARAEIERAVETAERAGDIDCAGRARLTLIEELGDSLPPDVLRSAYVLADEALARTQHADTIKRLRHTARRVFEAQQAEARHGRGAGALEEGAGAASPGTGVADLFGGAPVELTPEARAALARALQTADATENLRRAAGRTVARATGAVTITADAVEAVALRARHEGAGDYDFIEPWAGFSLKGETRRFERPFVELALRASAGRVSHAARLLGFAQAAQLTSLIQTKHPELVAARSPVIKRGRSTIGRRGAARRKRREGERPLGGERPPEDI